MHPAAAGACAVMPERHIDSSMLQLYDRELRIEIEYPDMRREALPGLVRYIRPAPGMSFISYSRLEAAGLDTAIQTQAAHFNSQGLRLTWKVLDHDSPPELKAHLLGNGFLPDDPGALMVLDLQQTPASLMAAIPSSVRHLHQREELEDVIAIEQQVWGGNFDWMRQRMGGHLEVPGYLSIYIATVDDQPACCGWTYYPPRSQFASLWGGSSVPQYRKRGLFTAILAARVQEAARRGRRYLIVEAGPESRPIVARHGFRLLDYVTDYELPIV
jgi:hypothetical protein